MYMPVIQLITPFRAKPRYAPLHQVNIKKQGGAQICKRTGPYQRGVINPLASARVLITIYKRTPLARGSGLNVL